MSYIGNSPTNVAFQTDTFSGTGSQTAFTMSVAPANTTSVLVAVTGVLQDPSTYSVSGTTLTFSAAPPSGTSNISVRYLGIPASGVTTTAYRTVTNTTASAGQTSFTIPSYTVGYIDVFRNGVYLPTTDYTATTGTTVVLNNAATVGDTITTESFFVSSVLNALPTTGGTLSGNLVVNGDETISGNVGIGTVSPGAKLDVTTATAGTNFKITGNNFAGGNFVGTSVNTSGVFLGLDSGGGFVTNVRDAGYLAYSTTNTERMRISSGGEITMGTSSLSNPPSQGLLLLGQQTNSQLAVGHANGTGTGQYYAVFGYNGTTIGGITQNGTAAVAYNTSSDYRLKENIAPMTGALNKVAALKPVTFKWKSDGTDGQGFIAHELQAVVPDCVHGEKDGTEIYTDDDGNEQTRPKYQGIDTSFLVATLTAAIQELKALVDAQASTITQLQADVAALKGTP